MPKTKTAPDTNGIDVDALIADVDLPADPDDEDVEETPEQMKARLDAAVVSLDFKGETFTIPKRRGRWRMGVHRDLGNGNLDEALIKLVGEARYARLDAAGWTWDDFDELATKLQVLINEECLP